MLIPWVPSSQDPPTAAQRITHTTSAHHITAQSTHHSTINPSHHSTITAQSTHPITGKQVCSISRSSSKAPLPSPQILIHPTSLPTLNSHWPWQQRKSLRGPQQHNNKHLPPHLPPHPMGLSPIPRTTPPSSSSSVRLHSSSSIRGDFRGRSCSGEIRRIAWKEGGGMRKEEGGRRKSTTLPGNEIDFSMRAQPKLAGLDCLGGEGGGAGEFTVAYPNGYRSLPRRTRYFLYNSSPNTYVDKFHQA